MFQALSNANAFQSFLKNNQIIVLGGVSDGVHG